MDNYDIYNYQFVFNISLQSLPVFSVDYIMLYNILSKNDCTYNVNGYFLKYYYLN